MTIAESIQDLKDRVLSAYDACEEKGAELPDVKNTANLPECIRSIQRSSPSYEDVCLEVDFCKGVLSADETKSSYGGSWICLRYSGLDYERFALGVTGVRAIKTSDGKFYSFEHDGDSVTHHWDNSKDFSIGGISSGQKFNWVIYYYDADNIQSNSSELDCLKAANLVYVFDLDLQYVVSSGSVANSYGLSRCNYVVQSFDFIGQHRCYGSNNTFASFCHSCYALVKLPDALDTSAGDNFSYFCCNCYSLAMLPEGIDFGNATKLESFCAYCYNLMSLPESFDASKVQNFKYFCIYCYQLKKLPDGMDVSSGTDFASFCLNCSSLARLSERLDIRKGTSFANFCSGCCSLTKANVVLPSGYGITTLNVSNKLTVASMRYIADNAPITSGHTLTIGSTNIARADAYDPTIITTLTSKGWMVN